MRRKQPQFLGFEAEKIRTNRYTRRKNESGIVWRIIQGQIQVKFDAFYGRVNRWNQRCEQRRVNFLTNFELEQMETKRSIIPKYEEDNI